MKTKPTPTPAEIAAAAIAKEILEIESLEERGRDRHDFHDIYCLTLKKALVRAYEMGREARQ